MKSIDLFVVGAQKTGSTTVFNWLKSTGAFNAHSQPEMSFFMLKHEYELGYKKAFKDYFEDGDERPVLAKHAMAAYDKETLLRIKSQNPEVRVIFIMRHPIERAYSAFWYARKMGWEHLKSFSEAIDAESSRLTSYIENRNLCYLYNSRYEIHVDRIIDIFGRDRVLLLTEKDIRKGEASVVRLVDAFIGGASLVRGASEKERFNQGGVPRSYFFSSVIAKISMSQGWAKKISRMIFTAKFRSRIRELLISLNDSGVKYPPISEFDRQILLENLKSSVDFYEGAGVEPE